MKSVWLKNGKVIVKNGKVILCDHCPCACEIRLDISGWDYNRNDVDVPTHHVFTVSVKGNKPESILFAYDENTVDLGGTAVLRDDGTVVIEIDNLGTQTVQDNFLFSVLLHFPPDSIIHEKDINVEHAFDETATGTSIFSYEASGECLKPETNTENDEEFE